jgi:hypothetical protein
VTRLLLTFALVLSLAGCGEEKKPVDPSGAPADPKMFDKSKDPKAQTVGPKAN